MLSPALAYERLARRHGRFIVHPDRPELLWVARSYGRLPLFEAARRGLVDACVALGEQAGALHRYTVEGGRLVTRPAHSLADRLEVRGAA